MANKYTICIYENGKNCKFKQFALECAKAFIPTKALYTLRSKEPSLPDEVKPGTYNKTQLQDATKKLETLQRLSPEEKIVEYKKYVKTIDTNFKTFKKENLKLRKNYEAMIKKVQGWNPPTHDHIALKSFMLSNLMDSLQNDCFPVYQRYHILEMDDWFKSELETATSDVKKYTEYYNDEVKDAQIKTNWIQELKKSLPKD